MNASIFRMICRLLIASLLLMSFASARATMIGVDQLSGPATGAVLERAAVAQTLSRADVAQQLQAMGIDPQAALERVNAMTDSEVRHLAGQIDTLPAGAHSASGWWIAAVVVIALVVWYMYK